MTLAGTPATTVRGGTSFVTTAPAPTTAPSPIVTPGQIVTRAPSQTLLRFCSCHLLLYSFILENGLKRDNEAEAATTAKDTSRSVKADISIAQMRWRSASTTHITNIQCMR